ncbi:MAG: LCP family protein [Christensenellales bacterium]|jgi:LCP family protein required for cell wall assembly
MTFKRFMRNAMIVILTGVLVVVIGGGMYLYDFLRDISDERPIVTYDNEGNEVEVSTKPLGSDVINVLCLGLDSREDDGMKGNTDVIMIVSLDVKAKRVRMVSIMRDLWVGIPGYWSERINAAYAFGGIDACMNTVNETFDLDIDHYAIVNFNSVKNIVNRVGGVEIDVSQADMKQVNRNVRDLANEKKQDPNTKEYLTEPGLQRLNGDQAVAYGRIRRSGNSDFQRTARQREVLQQLIGEVMTISVTSMPGLLDDVRNDVVTNLTPNQMMNIGATVLAMRSVKTEELRIPVDGSYSDQTIDGKMVLVANYEENARIIKEFLAGDYVPAEKQY